MRRSPGGTALKPLKTQILLIFPANEITLLGFTEDIFGIWPGLTAWLGLCFKLTAKLNFVLEGGHFYEF
jgi:hypothetical protein